MTGGTIAKTYDRRKAILRNSEPVVVELVKSLRIEGARISFFDLMHKDSQDVDQRDRRRIVGAVRSQARQSDAIVITHGTDTMAETGEALRAEFPDPPVPIVLTGAIVPFVIQGSDGLQNVTEALLASRLLAPGVYAVFHGRALAFPGVVKDHAALTFIHSPAKADR